MKRIHSALTLGLALVSAGALVHCGYNDDIGYESVGGYAPDASAYDGGTSTQKDGAASDGASSCVSIDYSQARSCVVPVDAGPDANVDAGDAGSRSNAKACKTSFDCAGICCSCPAKDAGADAGDAGPTETFTAYACACGACQIDPSMCVKMAAGDPTLCP
ncbi:MAG: hypothetical protein JWM74_161 [Myxococcaceae bacterium]|nr:hypothetical protein [Myxococcaceae bacterium]